MELKPNMYVRTKDRGIAKFYGWNAYDKNKVAIHTHNEGDIEITPVIDKNTIIKASHNIIDLIEVGDYVNGQRVNYINKDNDYFTFKFGSVDYTLKSNFNSDTKYLAKEDIKSILTKEQFESMSYKVED